MLKTVLKMMGLRNSTGETDVTDDSNLAESRATGGSEGDGTDAASTTGTGASEEFVGRVAGQDDGSERTMGSEARALGKHELRDPPGDSARD